MPPRDPLYRVHLRPSVDQWRGDEPIMLKEAVALFFPEGPLTISSFRSAIRRGELAFKKLAGKVFTTPDAVREMLRPDLRVPTKMAANERPPAPGRPTEAQLRASQKRALALVRDLKDRARSLKRPSKP